MKQKSTIGNHLNPKISQIKWLSFINKLKNSHVKMYGLNKKIVKWSKRIEKSNFKQLQSLQKKPALYQLKRIA